MKKKILISIVITYYKKKNFIKKTLNSILQQKYKNYEIILVFDEKSQKNFEFVKKLLTKFKRKKIINNKKNLGVSKSRNIALKYCKGSLISFIDSDDIWFKDKLEYQVHKVYNNKKCWSTPATCIRSISNLKINKKYDYIFYSIKK